MSIKQSAFDPWSSVSRLCLCGALLLSGTAIAAPETVARIESPDKVLTVSLELDDGRLAYRVDRLGEPVIAPSRLGFLLRTGSLEHSLALDTQRTQEVDETWEHPWGESRCVRNRYRELRRVDAVNAVGPA